jgi:histidyl-tRNA synthetase
MAEAAEQVAIAALQSLRAHGIRAEISYRGTLKKRLERANKIGAAFAIIIGEDEIARGVAQVKDLTAGTQSEWPMAGLPDVGPWHQASS